MSEKIVARSNDEMKSDKENTEDIPVKLRSLKEADEGFVIDSWKQSSRYKSNQYFWVPRNLHLSIYGEIVSNIVKYRPDYFIIAHDEYDPDRICGWVCRQVMDDETMLLHYIYIKKDYRRQFGISELLLNAAFGGKLTDDEKPILTNWSEICNESFGDMDYRPKYFMMLAKEIELEIAQHEENNGA